MAQKGWFTKHRSKRKGMMWVYHCRKIRAEDGKLVENTVNIASVVQLPRERDAWAEVERRHLIPDSGQAVFGRIRVNELVANYRNNGLKKLRVTTQSTTDHILDRYILPRWGSRFALDINPNEIEQWLDALPLADPTKEKIRRVMNVVYRRGQKSRLLPMTGDGNPVQFVTQSSKTNYRAVLVSPEQARQIMTGLENPYRTLVLLVAVTGLRISEALGLQWRDLDYQGHAIHLRRVWVGSSISENLKTESSDAPVPLGDLLADALRSWCRETPYWRQEDWIFASAKLKGHRPLSASIMAADKLRPSAIKAGIRLNSSQRFGFHNLRHSLATFLVRKGKDPKTIQELMRHKKVTTTLQLYSQAMDDAKLEAQQEIASAITGRVAAD